MKITLTGHVDKDMKFTGICLVDKEKFDFFELPLSVVVNEFLPNLMEDSHSLEINIENK
jgi:hypothetical protein